MFEINLVLNFFNLKIAQQKFNLIGLKVIGNNSNKKFL